MDAFSQAYNFMRKKEGGFADSPIDRGGATMYGISSKYWPEDFNTVKTLVDAGRVDEAENHTQNFYRKNFWEPLGGDTLPPEAATAVFDTAVNSGVDTAKNLYAKSGNDVNKFLQERENYVRGIVQNDPTQQGNLDGWLNRINSLRAPEQGLSGGGGNDFLAGGSGDDPFADLVPAAPMAAGGDADPFEDLVPKTTVVTPEAQSPYQPVQAPPQKQAPTKSGLLMRGMYRGVGDLVGLPGDIAGGVVNLASKGINKVAGTNIPMLGGNPGEVPNLLGSENIADTFSKLYEAIPGTEKIDTNNLDFADNAIYQGARMGTGAAAGGAGLMNAAEKIPRTALPKARDAFLEPYRQNAGRALFNDTAAGVGSGTGVAAADAVAPDSPIATLMGSVLGGIGGATTGGLMTAGKEGVKDMARSASEGFTVDKRLTRDPETQMPVRRKDADQAASILQNKAVDIDKAKTNLEEGTKFYTENKLPMPGTGALSNDTGLIGVENAARVNDPVPFIERDKQVKTAQGDKLRGMGPEVPEANLRDTQKFAQTEADTMRAAATAKTADARTRLTQGEIDLEQAKQAEAAVSAPIAAARGTQAKASTELDKEIVGGALQPRTQKKNDAFDAIDPNKEIQRDIAPIAQTAKAIQDSVGKLSPEASGVPPEFMAKLEKLAPKAAGTDGELPSQGETGGTVALGDMLDARKYLNTAAENAQRNGNFDLAKNIRELKAQINAEADRVIAEGGQGSVEAAAAKKAYEEDYAPFFAEGFGRNFRDKIQKDPTGRTALPPSKTAGFFFNDSAEAAADLKRITSIAKNPEAAETAVSNYMKAQVANLVKPDGTLEPSTLRKWMDRHAGSIDPFPKVKAEMEQLQRDVLNGRNKKNEAFAQIGKLAGDLKYAEKEVSATEARINQSVLKTLIDKNPENAAKAILGDADPEARMAETLQLIGKNEGALKAFQRSVADHLEAQFTGARTETTANESFAVMQSKVESYLKKPGVEAAITKLYEGQPDAMNSLRVAQRIGRDMAKTNVRASSGSDTAEKSKNVMNTLEAALKLKFGMLKGGGMMRSLKLARDTIPGLNNDAAVQRLIVRAQLEPDLAMHLYGRDVEKMPARLWTAKLNRLLGYSAALRETQDEDKPLEVTVPLGEFTKPKAGKEPAQ